MRTLVLQAIVSVLYLIFGAGSLLAARRIAAGANRLAWRAVGGGFSLFGVSCILQSAFSVLAYRAGAGSATYLAYLRAAPVMNHGRTFLILFLGIGLAVALSFSILDRLRATVAFVSLCLAGLIGGGIIGYYEGSLVEYTHYRAVAIFDVAELVILLTALFIGLYTDRIDRLLFAALSVYAFGAALNIIWMIALTAFGRGTWVPEPWLMAAYRVILIGIMAGCGIRRAQLANRGIRVRGLGGADTPLRVGIQT